MTLFSERRHSENPSGGQESLEVSALATPVPAEARPRKPMVKRRNSKLGTGSKQPLDTVHPRYCKIVKIFTIFVYIFGHKNVFYNYFVNV